MRREGDMIEELAVHGFNILIMSLSRVVVTQVLISYIYEFIYIKFCK